MMNEKFKILLLTDNLLQVEELDKQVASLGLEGVSSLYQAGLFQQVGKLKLDLALFDFQTLPPDLIDGLRYLKEEYYNQEIPLLITLPAVHHQALLEALGPDNLDLLPSPLPTDYLLARLRFWLKFLSQKRALMEQAASCAPLCTGAPKQVLLVEDDEVNQQLTLLLFNQMGITAEVAEEGAQALHMLQDKDYGLILMDLELPGPDGLETCRRIRQWEQSQGRDPVPIVALTGNEAERHREACLAAGMDDYLTKPLHGSDLQSLLRQWLPRGKPPDPSQEPPSMGESLLDHLNQELRPSLWQLVQTFLQKLPNNLKHIQRALNQKDAEGLKQTANHLRGSCSSFWAVAMTVVEQEIEPLLSMIMDLEEIERLARMDDFQKAKEQVANLEEQAQALVQHIKRVHADQGQRISP